MRKQRGITLIALVVTIIILTILAGVSINLVLGENGIITIAKRAKENIELAQIEEEKELNELYAQLEAESSENKINKANAPKLLTGMTPIKFEMPTATAMGTVVQTTAKDTDWYEYGTTYDETNDTTTKRWANAQTEDGSMWVWIPRFAYKITGETIDVKFLIGTSDNYYDEEGNIQTAQRQKTADQIIDSTKEYTVHPAFTNESSINYANGGWDKELTGIWVAKFAAGYASGNNSAPVKSSNENYSQSTGWVEATERGADDKQSGGMDARNWLDGVYGSTTTSIKYPTFQGTTYAMNYINHSDSYKIARALTDDGNIYGLSSNTANSHLMKNSEWGSVAYLSKSQYGQNDEEIKVNNANLLSGNRKRTSTSGKSGVDSVYGITGCTSNETSEGSITTTIEAINGVSENTANANGIYVWNQKTGQNASTTGTIYGIYDISGCVWERTADFISNGHEYLLEYGKSLLDETKVNYTIDENTKTVTANTGASTKHVTIYPYSSPESSNIDTASQNNFKNNTKIYGDAVRETTSANAGTSNSGWSTSSWNSDASCFPALFGPAFKRGGCLWDNSAAGAFAFISVDGASNFHYGFRAVLVAAPAI